MKRRSFLHRTFTGSALLSVGAFPFSALAEGAYHNITILHTNDVHSRIEPFPKDSKYAGLGGVAARANIIKKVRQEQQHVLLLDSGDILQGTPYFNYYGGKLEFELMSKMGYDASTIGNHDFDGGIGGLAGNLRYAKFPLLCANYNFMNTPLNGKIEEYKIFERGAVKIGVFGVGIELLGLVPEKLFGNTIYNDPIKKANETASFLRNEQGCNFIICLSHLGYKYKENKVSDLILAKNSQHIDLILGGHTHTFFREPERVKNTIGEAVLINQVGWAGLVLGRVDVVFDEKKKKKKFLSGTVKVI